MFVFLCILLWLIVGCIVFLCDDVALTAIHLEGLKGNLGLRGQIAWLILDVVLWPLLILFRCYRTLNRWRTNEKEEGQT